MFFQELLDASGLASGQTGAPFFVTSSGSLHSQKKVLPSNLVPCYALSLFIANEEIFP